MSLMTGAEYIESLRKLNTRVYMFGEKVDNWVDHPIIRPSINCVAQTYELAQDPEYADLMTAKSNITGKTVNRFTHLHQSTEDLIKKVKMQRLLGQKTASCFQRCVSMDAFNAVYSTTFEIDEKYGTAYHQRFVKFLEMVRRRIWWWTAPHDGPEGGPQQSAPRPGRPGSLRTYHGTQGGRHRGLRRQKPIRPVPSTLHWHIIMPTIAMGRRGRGLRGILSRVPKRRGRPVHDLRQAVLRYQKAGRGRGCGSGQQKPLAGRRPW